MNTKQKVMIIPKNKCNRCGSRSNVTDAESGEIFCGSCGFVMSEKIESYGPEHRNFMDGEDGSRTGAGTSLSRHDMGLATIIGPTDRDATGKALSSSMKHTIGRLRIWDSRSQAHKSSDRNFRIAFNELSKLKDKLGLSEKSKRFAAKILHDYEQSGEVAGKSPTGLAATALYLACVKMDERYSQRDISKAANITEVTIRNRAAAMRRTLNLNDKSHERKSSDGGF